MLNSSDTSHPNVETKMTICLKITLIQDMFSENKPNIFLLLTQLNLVSSMLGYFYLHNNAD